MIFNSKYILKVIDNGKIYTYEYNNLNRLNNHYDIEESCMMYEYNDGNYHFIKAK
jgi:hypothetical protein